MLNAFIGSPLLVRLQQFYLQGGRKSETVGSVNNGLLPVNARRTDEMRAEDLIPLDMKHHGIQ